MEKVVSWVFSDSFGDGWEIENKLFEATLEVNSKGDLLIDDTPVRDIENELDKFSKTNEEEFEKTRNELTDALHRGDFQKVEELSEELEHLKRNFEWIRFFLELLISLNKGKTQVVSFSAPDCLIALWEAYGDTDLKSVFNVEEAM